MYVKLYGESRPGDPVLLEFGTREARILINTGSGLPPSDSGGTPFQLEGLTYGTPRFNGVFFAHPHSVCLSEKILPDIPVFAGSETQRVVETVSDFSGLPCPVFQPGFLNCQPIQLGDFRITPIGTDRGTRDAFMFLIQGEGKTVLYTGDYRAVEKILPETRRLLGIAGPLDLMISEGPRLCHAHHQGRQPEDEAGVCQRAAEKMRLCDGTAFLLCDPTDEARVQALAQAAVQSGRQSYEDLFQAALREDILPQQPDGTRKDRPRFLTCPAEPEDRIRPYLRRLCPEKNIPAGAEALATLPGRKAIFLRPSMLPFLEAYLDARPPEEEKSPLLLYSLWRGSRRTPEIRRLLDICKKRHISVADLQGSSHFYSEVLIKLTVALQPAALLPIHCGEEARQSFSRLYDSFLSLNDGIRWEVP